MEGLTSLGAGRCLENSQLQKCNIRVRISYLPQTFFDLLIDLLIDGKGKKKAIKNAHVIEVDF